MKKWCKDSARYGLLIDRDMHFSMEEKKVQIHLTSHLFQKREGEDQRRSFMFKSTWQYRHIISEAFTKYNIWEFRNGKVVFLFKYNEDTYGILLDIKLLEENVYSVSIITVDKLDDRHFVKHEMFGKEKNKIYSGYTLPFSYLRQVRQRVDRGSGYEVYYSNYFMELDSFQTYRETVDQNRLLCSIRTRIERGSLLIGVYWLTVPIDNKGKELFLKVSIEKIWRNESEIDIIIFADLKFTYERVQNLKSSEAKNIIQMSREADKNFGTTTKIFGTKATGLKIKSKKMPSSV